MDREDGEMDGIDVDMAATGDNAVKLQELDEMKCRLKEMEEDTTIRDTQSNVTKEMQGPIAGRQHIQLVVRNNDELTKFLGAITMLPTVC